MLNCFPHESNLIIVSILVSHRSGCLNQIIHFDIFITVLLERSNQILYYPFYLLKYIHRNNDITNNDIGIVLKIK